MALTGYSSDTAASRWDEIFQRPASVGIGERLRVKPEDQGKRIVLEFDGVFRNASVFVNGHWVGENLSGYVPFEIDVTDFLDYAPGEIRGQDEVMHPDSGPVKNVVSLRVDAIVERWLVL